MKEFDYLVTVASNGNVVGFHEDGIGVVSPNGWQPDGKFRVLGMSGNSPTSRNLEIANAHPTYKKFLDWGSIVIRSGGLETKVGATSIGSNKWLYNIISEGNTNAEWDKYFSDNIGNTISVTLAEKVTPPPPPITEKKYRYRLLVNGEADNQTLSEAKTVLIPTPPKPTWNPRFHPLTTEYINIPKFYTYDSGGNLIVDVEFLSLPPEGKNHRLVGSHAAYGVDVTSAGTISRAAVFGTIKIDGKTGGEAKFVAGKMQRLEIELMPDVRYDFNMFGSSGNKLTTCDAKLYYAYLEKDGDASETQEYNFTIESNTKPTARSINSLINNYTATLTADTDWE